MRSDQKYLVGENNHIYIYKIIGVAEYNLFHSNISVVSKFIMILLVPLLKIRPDWKPKMPSNSLKHTFMKLFQKATDHLGPWVISMVRLQAILC